MQVNRVHKCRNNREIELILNLESSEVVMAETYSGSCLFYLLTFCHLLDLFYFDMVFQRKIAKINKKKNFFCVLGVKKIFGYDEHTG